MISIKEILNASLASIKKHSPEILTAIGITGMIASTVLAVKATPKATNIINSKKEEYEEEDIPNIELVKAVWKYYVPSVVLTASSAVCIVCAGTINVKRNIALSTAYTITEKTLTNFKNKATEMLGEEKVEEIKTEIAKDQIKDKQSSDIIISSKGDILCYDVAFDRLFKSDIATIEKAVNRVNKDMLDEMYVSLNDLYYELGIKNIPIGDDVGWNINTGLIEVYFSAMLTDDDIPCVVLNYSVSPKCNFYKNI